MEQPALFDDMEPKGVNDISHAAEAEAFRYWLEKADVPWAGLFASLLAQGFSWREAAVAAWMVPFDGERQPKTQNELAQLLGCGVDTVSKHKSKPRVQAAALAHRRLAFLPHLDSVMAAHLETVRMPGGRQTSERLRFLEELGVYQPRQEGVSINVLQQALAQANVQDMSQLSEEQLRQLMQAGEVGDDE